MSYTPEKTVHYKTHVKEALVGALDPVFKRHKDVMLQGTKTTIDFPRTKASYPAIVVRFFERTIDNAGIGHVENLQDEDGAVYPAKHYFYKGDIEFGIYGLSSYDRDLISDTLVQTIAMGDLEAYTNQFFNRIYDDGTIDPASTAHYLNVNSDSITGYGESQTQVPWMAEDDLVYMASYRINVFGEFYSLPPDTPFGLIQKVLIYPYIADLEDVPTGNPDDQAPWV